MEFRILGPLEVRGGHGVVPLGGIKPRAVLAVLLLHPNEPVSTDRLALALWGAEAPAGAVRTVHVHVSRLRKALGDPDVVTTTPAGYCVRMLAGELDAERFARGVVAGRHALDAGDAAEAAAELRDALALWRGPALADLAFEPFAQVEIARLEEQRLAALELRMEAELACGLHRALVAELHQLAAEHPTREGFARLRMLALYRSGRQTEALDAFREARAALVAEVGVEPGPSLRRLQEAVLRQDPSLDPPPPPADFPPELDVDGTAPMVGRNAALVRLHEVWDEARRGSGRLVGIVGAPGMGKTRLAAEVAGEAHRSGAVVLYARGSQVAASAPAMLARALAAARPTLVVVDDADRGGDVAPHLTRLATGLTRVPVLILATAIDANALPANGHDAVHLEPLGADAVRALAAELTTDGEGLPPGELLETGAGVPGRVRELVVGWCRSEAARRVDSAASRTVVGRAELRSIEQELTGGVLELQAAHERLADPDDNGAHVVCPFKGLAAFDVADAPYFFGRERLVSELVAGLVGAPLLGVVGPSGSGKSSVVRAGLLPALADGVLPGSERWTQVIIRPGEHPMRELRTAVAALGEGGHAVVAVDQFEETFVACRDESERRAFIAELIGGGGRVVVLALRADHYGRCAAYPELSRLLAAHHVLVGAMRQDELRRAVERPAQRVRLRIQPALVDALVADVEHEPGALPMLSTALLELWQHRDGRQLRLSAYEASGGVRGAVARHAEDAFKRLDPTAQEVARRTLLQLATDDGAGGVERRRVPMAELHVDEDEDVTRAVELLAAERLLTVSEGEVELAHEALLREWPRLARWLDEDAHVRRLQRHVRDSAREWDAGGRDPADLYRGARLAPALEWRAAHEPSLTDTERAFLDAGRAAERSELAAAQRRARRLRGLAACLAVLLVVAAGSALVAARETRRARDQQRTALSRSVAVEAAALVHDQFALSALLGLEAYRLHPTFEARSAVLGALGSFEQTSRVLGRHAAPVMNLAFSSDGTLAAADNAGTVRLWDVASRRPLGAPLDNHTDWLETVAFSPDGRTLVAAGADRALHFWDARARRPLGHPAKGHAGSLYSVAFSDDGHLLAAADDSGTVRLWDPRARRPLRRLVTKHNEAGEGWILDVAFSPDGRTLATSGEVGELELWDVRTRRPIGGMLMGHGDWIRSVAFSPDGSTLATGSDDDTVILWNTRTQRALGQPLTGHTGNVRSVAFSPDGRTLASGSDDGTVRLWDVAARRPLGQPLIGHGDPVRSVAFSPNGRMLASGGDDQTIRLWDAILWSVDRRAVERRVCGAVRHSLTREEWAEFLPGEPYRETCPA